MSGPKDFTIVFTAGRRQAQQARLRLLAETQSAATQSRLSKARIAAADKWNANTAKSQAKAKAAKERAEAERLALEAENERQRKSALAEQSERDREAAEHQRAAEAALVEELRRVEETERLAALAAQQRESKHGDLETWGDILKEDSSVSSFSHAAFQAWRDRVRSLTTGDGNFDSVADALLAEASTIQQSAMQIQHRFEARNAMLSDVIESMKELGYFVSDPQFADASDPTGPAILKATCGSQTVTASVDLASAVKSVWDGEEHEHCKEKFFDFVDVMRARGSEVHAERSDLRDRPKLLQKGANELPQRTDRSVNG